MPGRMSQAVSATPPTIQMNSNVSDVQYTLSSRAYKAALGREYMAV